MSEELHQPPAEASGKPKEGENNQELILEALKKMAEEQELLERKKKEEKYQKRLNLRRKIFPFLKK